MAYFQRKAGFGPLQAAAVFRSTHLSGTTDPRLTSCFVLLKEGLQWLK
jgi:hypothetical protein